MRCQILHIITSLDTGGAEMALVKLICETSNRIDHVVVCLSGRGTLSTRIESVGVKVWHLGIREFRLSTLWSTFKWIGSYIRERPNIIQGWMYHGNLVAWFLYALTPGKTKLFWNIRQSLYDLSKEKILTRTIIRLSRLVSRTPTHIIYNSAVSAGQHEEIGYSPNFRKVIPNGFDYEKFKPDQIAREVVRQKLFTSTRGAVVIHVARFHPMKDHETSLRAAANLLIGFPETKFVMVGKHMTVRNKILMTYIEDLNLSDSVILLGERDDLPELLAASDIGLLSSAWGEGFPNVIGEAMASGIPCVVTDVGDSAIIVNDCGLVVPPRDSSALSSAVGQLLADDCLRIALGRKSRERIKMLYSLGKICNEYLDLYEG